MARRAPDSRWIFRCRLVIRFAEEANPTVRARVQPLSRLHLAPPVHLREIWSINAQLQIVRRSAFYFCVYSHLTLLWLSQVKESLSAIILQTCSAESIDCIYCSRHERPNIKSHLHVLNLSIEATPNTRIGCACRKTSAAEYTASKCLDILCYKDRIGTCFTIHW